MKLNEMCSRTWGSLRFAVFAAVGLCGASVFAANTWWVAKEDPNASDANAGTEAAPFRTIQAALDNPNFVAGDTVNVKRGIYDEGESISEASVISNRVLITKAVHLVGVEGAAVTHIVGAKSPGSTATGGRGDYATRCIFVDEAARTADMVIEGFTIRGGVTGCRKGSNNKELDSTVNHGGNIYSSGNYPLVIDCVISNGAALKGAGLRGGTAVRCHIVDNWGASSGVAVNGGRAYACVIAHNTGSQTISSSYLCYCTLFANGSSLVLTGSGASYSCIFIDNGAPNTDFTATKTSGSVFTATNGAGTVRCDRWQIVGPAVGDWRVVAGSAAETSGLASHAGLSAFSHIPAADRAKDFYGNPIPSSGTIMAGAVQASAPVVAGGIALNTSGVNGMAIDGHSAHPGDFVLATAWPTQFTVTATAKTVNRYIRRIGTSYDFVAPRMDESILVMPPPAIGTIVTNDVKYATSEFWVDPVNGDDENAGTEASPFKTLQRSYVAVTNAATDYPVIHAAAGDYREGGEPMGTYNGSSDYALTNRLCIGKNFAVRYKGAGAGQSFIWGEPDPSAADGLGNAAIGCVGVYGYLAIVQGFTLTNGYTRVAADSRGNGDIVFGRSGGSTMPILADCTISGCSARDALSYFVRLQRCRVVGNRIVKGTLTNGGHFSGCLFAGNTLTDTSRSGVTGDACIGCSYLGAQKSVCPFGNSVRIYGCVIDTGNELRAKSYPAVSMADNLSTWNYFSTVISAVAGFNDPANGDFRVKTYSGALRCTPLPSANDAWAAEFCRYAVGDVDGRPLISPDGEHVLAGAVQETVSTANAVYFRTPNGGIGDGTTPYAEGDLSSSEPIALTRATATRPCIGFVLDGVTNMFDDVALPVALAPSANGHTVVALYTKDWYVSDEDGDDGDFGYTPKTAKKTLAAALSEANLASGDTVHAAPGTYDKGVMTYSETKQLRSRAIVPAGVTLVGDEGAERTIIIGAAATVDADANGLGTNAIRCVTLTDAAIRGFTLTGGHTACIGGHGTEQEQNAAKSNAENIGGGVGFATGSTDKHVVTDCIISNNVAWRGGGAYYASLRRCRIIGNKGCDGSGAASGTYRCEHYGCVVAHQRANYNVMYPSGVYDSTLVHTTGSQFALYVTGQDCPVRNTVVIGSTNNDNTQNKNVAYNSFFTKVSAKTSEDYFGAGSALVDASELLLDADYRPVVGANVAIDGGSTNYYKTAQSGKTDILGGQRIYNGSLDAGALEADWRPRYAADMGGAAGLVVTEASPEVVEDAGRVCISNGTVTVAWANTRAPRKTLQTYCIEVTGNGTLTVTVDGESTDYTSADGALKLERKTTAANTDMVFAYAPGEEDTGCAILSGFDRASGSVVIFR